MANNKKTRILIVDDSTLMRKMLSEIINTDKNCEVIATSKNGMEALKSVAVLKPDVVTLDLEMPELNGITALKYIMSEWPTPVVIITGYTKYNGEETIKCLEYGALDLVMKPGGATSLNLMDKKEEILTKVKLASTVEISKIKPLIIEDAVVKKAEDIISANKMVAIASSTGGPRALAEVLPRIESDIEAGILVIQHMPAGFTSSLANRLNKESKIIVKEAEDGELIRKGVALISPGGYSIKIIEESDNKKVKLEKTSNNTHFAPSADIAIKSLAPLYKADCLGVVMTGMGSDSVEGIKAIKKFGGKTIAQDQSSCIVYGMPKAAVKSGYADEIVSLDDIGSYISRWAKR